MNNVVMSAIVHAATNAVVHRPRNAIVTSLTAMRADLNLRRLFQEDEGVEGCGFACHALRMKAASCPGECAESTCRIGIGTPLYNDSTIHCEIYHRLVPGWMADRICNYTRSVKSIFRPCCPRLKFLNIDAVLTTARGYSRSPYKMGSSRTRSRSSSRAGPPQNTQL